MNKEEQKAYDMGYRTFQIRRGVNPYAVTSPEWQAYENGWCRAFIENAPDLSRQELERRVAGRTNWHPAFRNALEARK